MNMQTAARSGLVFFILGVVFLGASVSNSVFLPLGLAFLAIGIVQVVRRRAK